MHTAPASLVRLLSDLVSCPSVNPEGDPGGTVPGEAALAELVADHLRALDAGVEIREVAPGRPNVIATFEPARPARATVVLAPHLDTVGVRGMTVPPFRLTRESGRLYGRGTCDTKGPMAALFWALRKWTRSAACRQSRVRWIVAVTAGEEEGSLGARALVKDAGFGADFAVALEPTDLRVVHAAKGVLRAWLATRGRAAHGSQPEKGVNAVYALLPLAAALRDHVAPALQRKRHPLLGPATLNLGVMNGGFDMNIVPDSCRVGLDIRLHPDCGCDAALKLLENARVKFAPEATLTVHRTGPALLIPRTLPWARRLRRAGRGWAAANWFCDANFFAEAGIPAVAFGPGSVAQAHTRDEYITARALREGADAYHRFLADNSRVGN